MGQYYHPVSLDKKDSICAHDFDNGLKLMEHSYIGNDVVEEVELLLAEGGAWYKTRLVWAGDYADPEPGTKENLYDIYGENTRKPMKMCSKLKDIECTELRYIVNHTKKEFVDKDRVIKACKEDDYKIHPLPLLTEEGNGQGGGDYRKTEDKRLGTWARNVISMEKNLPEGYTEIDGVFTE